MWLWLDRFLDFLSIPSMYMYLYGGNVPKYIAAIIDVDNFRVTSLSVYHDGFWLAVY